MTENSAVLVDFLKDMPNTESRRTSTINQDKLIPDSKTVEDHEKSIDVNA